MTAIPRARCIRELVFDHYYYLSAIWGMAWLAHSDLLVTFGLTTTAFPCTYTIKLWQLTIK